MESTIRKSGAGLSRPGWSRLVVFVVALLVLSMVSTPAMLAQDATEAPETPDVVIPGTGDEETASTPDAAQTPEDEETAEPETPEATPEDEEDSAGSGVGLDLSSTDPGNPAVIAHGLAFLTGDQSVWQVREVEPEGADDASAETTNAALVYQVEGTSIIRNDVTGKRALLNPGEAYFKAGGDAYTTIADSSDSVFWVFELVPSDDVADDAFYESPLIDDYDEGVFDMVLVRYVLEPGESADLPSHTGPALVMSTNGDIDIESGGLGLLGTGDGQLITEAGTVTNNSSDPVEYVLAGYGSEVADDTATTGTAADATAVPDNAATDDSTDTTDDEATTEELPADDTADDAAGGEQTSINITAEAELYVVVVVDGVTAFDGPIPQGGQSGEIAGTVFEVYTSNGGATLFTNACGEDFYMGYESGEANYYLTAEPCS
jgi:hypothetical protein